MNVKSLLVASALFATTFAVTPIHSANAEEDTGSEVWADYDYNDIKDLPSSVEIDITNPEETDPEETNPGEVAPHATSPVAFGQGSTYINRDGMDFYGTHATSVKNGKLIISFSVFGDLAIKKKGTTKIKILDQDSDVIYTKQNGIAMGETRAKTGAVGDTMISKSHHNVNLGWSTSDTDTVAQKKL